MHQLQGEYGYTHVWEVTAPAGVTPILSHPQQFHGPLPQGARFGVPISNSPYPTTLTPTPVCATQSAGTNPNASKRLHREHIYESPTFDGAILTRGHTYPYYCHGSPRCTHHPSRKSPSEEPPIEVKPTVVEPIEPSRYSLSEDTDDDDRYQLNFVKGPGYVPVEGSTSDPEVKAIPRAENHYT